MEINSLIFENIDVDEDFRWLLRSRFEEDDVFDLFNGEVNLIPFETDLKQKVDLPAVSLSIFQNGVFNPDDVQLQNYTPFSIEVNIYTSGKDRVLNNAKLANIIIRLLQSNGQMPRYYCRGLRLEENREVGTFLDNAHRRVIRMSGLCDNARKLIINRR